MCGTGRVLLIVVVPYALGCVGISNFSPPVNRAHAHRSHGVAYEGTKKSSMKDY